MDTTCTADDPELAERARRGDPRAWEAVCRAASPGLRASARRHVADRDEADDIVSEVFTRALTAIARYRADKPLIAWLHGIQRNVLREHARRHLAAPAGLDPTDSASQASPSAPAAAAVATDDPAATALDSIDAALAVALLRTLDDRARRIVYLRVCEGRSSDEVARIVHAEPAAVRMVQSRAIRKLQSSLNATA